MACSSSLLQHVLQRGLSIAASLQLVLFTSRVTCTYMYAQLLDMHSLQQAAACTAWAVIAWSFLTYTTAAPAQSPVPSPSLHIFRIC
jgi:hypothetical protein